MKAAELILEYIKVLAWPLIIALGFLFYGQDFINILKSREVEAFGLRIGSQVEELNDNYKAEIEALKAQLAQSELCDESNDLIDKLDNIEANLNKSLTQVRTSAITQTTETLSKADLAKNAETLGFQAILDRDINQARRSFSEAVNIWGEYHNVSEISNLLDSRKYNDLASDDLEGWEEIIEEILDKYSWGMPTSIRNDLLLKKEE